MPKPCCVLSGSAPTMGTLYMCRCTCTWMPWCMLACERWTWLAQRQVHVHEPYFLEISSWEMLFLFRLEGACCMHVQLPPVMLNHRVCRARVWPRWAVPSETAIACNLAIIKETSTFCRDPHGEKSLCSLSVCSHSLYAGKQSMCSSQPAERLILYRWPC
jgi:hypothetical protein